MKFVKNISAFTSNWCGLVLHTHKDYNLILVLKDKNGNTPRKRITKIAHTLLLEEIPSFDISHINKDWFKEIPTWNKG